MLMSYTAEIIRGWPGEGVLELDMPITNGATLQNGDVVTPQSDGTVNKVGASSNGAVGLVLRGNGDSASATQSGKAVVVWSGFIVRVQNAAGNIVPGSYVTGKNGVYTLATFNTDPIVGYCIGVTAASATNTASVTLVIF